MHFRKADNDRNGTLDGNELAAVVRELAQANRIPLTVSTVATEVRKCLDQFGNGHGGVDETGFCNFVGSMGDFFIHMAKWREVFDRFASKDGEMQETDAVMFFTHVFTCNGQQFTQAEVVKQAQDMFQEADKDKNSALSFGEFVQYARSNENALAKLLEKVLEMGLAVFAAAGGGAAVNMPRMLLDTEELAPDFDMEDAKESAAKRLFRKADQDGNGTLDPNELRQVIRDLASANGRRLSDQEVQNHAIQCYQKFANPKTGLTADHFEVYVASEPNLFGWLICWRNIFDKYVGQNGQICFEKSFALVQDIFRANGQNITAAEARQQATALFQEADADMSGELSFQEFVAYAQKNPEMFGRLAQINSPRKEERASGAMIWIADVFNRADTDRGGKLEADELKPIIRDLAAANGTFLTNNDVEAEIQNCLSFQAVPSGFKGVTLQEFLKYVDQNKQSFETLFHFRVLVRVFVREKRRARVGRKTERGDGVGEKDEEGESART